MNKVDLPSCRYRKFLSENHKQVRDDEYEIILITKKGEKRKKGKKIISIMKTCLGTPYNPMAHSGLLTELDQK